MKLKTYNEFLNESSEITTKGKLKIFNYGEDEVFYVETEDFGNLYLNSKFEESVGESKLKSLLDKKLKWSIIEWNHSAKAYKERYKINGILK